MQLRKSIHGSDRRRGSSRGQSILEFAAALPFLLLITIGSFALGVSLERYLAVSQLTRHAGNMYARDIGFDNVNSPARHLMVQSAGSLKLSTALGTCDSDVKSVVYLSQVQITPDEPPDTFANEGEPVILHRTLIGNSCVAASSIGTPPNAIWDPAADPDPGVVVDPFNAPGAVATLPSTMTSKMIPGETVFVIEVIYDTADLAFPGFITPAKMDMVAFF